MKTTINVPKNDTNIEINVSGKSVREVALEMGMLAWLLKQMADSDETYKDGFSFESEEEIVMPLPHLSYREWESDAEDYDFTSNSIIRRYERTDNVYSVFIDPKFMAWAKTDKPVDDFCKAQLHAMEDLMKARDIGWTTR